MVGDGRQILTGVGAQVDVTPTVVEAQVDVMHIRHGMWAGAEVLVHLKMGA